jgi:hypothetical protein
MRRTGRGRISEPALLRNELARQSPFASEIRPYHVVSWWAARRSAPTTARFRIMYRIPIFAGIAS